MPLVSIIIVNYNNASDVLRCLESIARWSGAHACEIIIVDNSSAAADLARLRAAPGAVRIIQNERNLGFGAANNRGAAQAQGEYLFFLNPDTYLLNDAVGGFLSFMESPQGRGAGAVGCLLEDADGNANHSYGDFQSMRLSEFLKRQLLRVPRSVYGAVFRRKPRVQARKKKTLSRPLKVDWITGADLFMRREAFLDAGGFDDRIFLYSEEIDLQRRLNGRGWSRWILDGPRIVHTHGRYDRMSNDGRIQFNRGLFSYFLLHEPFGMVLPAYALYKACCFINAICEMAQGEFGLHETVYFIRKFRLSDIRAAFHG